MAVVAREQAEARQSDIIASKRVVRSHRNKLALIIDLEDTSIITAASFTAIAFASAFAVVASCKLVVAQVSSTSAASAFTMVSTFAVADIIITMDLLEPPLRCSHPYFSSQSSLRLDSLLFL